MKRRTLSPLLLILLLFISLLCAIGCAQDVASFEKRITVKKLSNGLTLMICERPEAPVFSFYTLVDAGSAQDPMRQTGLAHMFEHMAFKGTDTIGTTDYAAEKPALAEVETAYAEYVAERDKTVGRDEEKLKRLEKGWKDAIAARRQVRGAQPVRQNYRAERRPGYERFHRLRRDCVSLFAAHQSAGAVGLSGIRALPASRVAGIL